MPNPDSVKNMRDNSGHASAPFAVMDCALIALATGRKAQNLRELRDHLQSIAPASVYYHFWGGLLLPRFEEREFSNDFASWARHGLHDDRLAERLSVIDPEEFHDIERLRQELIEVIEQRLDESDHVPWAKTDRQFEFLHSKIVVFDTGMRINRPEELPDAVRSMSGSSVFFHFIDAKRRPPQGRDDFSAWLAQFGEEFSSLCRSLEGIDPYFASLIDLRDRIAKVLDEHFDGGIGHEP